MPTFGVYASSVPAVPSTEDTEIASVLTAALNQARELGDPGADVRLSWPNIGDSALSEYDPDTKIFACAFPWLFPSGVGDFLDFREHNIGVAEWAKNLIMYEDNRFVKDKMFSFFVLNYVTRRRNQSSGNFFVKKFSHNDDSDLQSLKQSIRNGDHSFVHEISYFGKQVVGSDSYWRNKRSELYTWINHHVEMGNGPPTYFLTLSCAEYHWPDIMRLVQERILIKTGKSVHFDAKHSTIVQMMNDYSSVVQEYFQQRVRLWLSTVGKDILGIQHYWLRYEFAPSRGQIHAHILAISDDKRILHNMHDSRHNEKKQAKILSAWASKKFGLTATHDPNFERDEETHYNPVDVYLADIDDISLDEALLKEEVETHECSAYCLRDATPHEKEQHQKKNKKKVRCLPYPCCKPTKPL